MSKKTRRWQSWALPGLVLLVTALSGCQTWVAGMTLPSPHYLEHPPQYIPPSPPFPLERELAQMQDNLIADDEAVRPLPAQVPGGAFRP